MCLKSDHFIYKFYYPLDQPEEHKLVFNIIPNLYLIKASMYVGSMAKS